MCVIHGIQTFIQTFEYSAPCYGLPKHTTYIYATCNPPLLQIYQWQQMVLRILHVSYQQIEILCLMDAFHLLNSALTLFCPSCAVTQTEITGRLGHLFNLKCGSL